MSCPAGASGGSGGAAGYTDRLAVCVERTVLVETVLHGHSGTVPATTTATTMPTEHLANSRYHARNLAQFFYNCSPVMPASAGGCDNR